MARDERQVQHEICFRLASGSRGASTRVELCGRVVAVEVLGREGGECARTAELDAFEGDVALVGARRRIERIVSIARSREESVTRRGARED